MPSERDKMLAGELYDPLDPELSSARVRARDLCQALNATREADQDERRRLVIDIFGAGGGEVWMQPPFFCDYGANIFLGRRVFFNFNCVTIGSISGVPSQHKMPSQTRPLTPRHRDTARRANPNRARLPLVARSVASGSPRRLLVG